MEIEIERGADPVVVRAAGDINAATCPKLEETLVGLIEGGTSRLVLDLGDTRYISSAGLRVLLIAAKRLTGNGKFALSRPSAAVRQILDMTGFSRIITIHDDLETARRALAPGG
jgi:anti-anti-sigma factor